jgi:hypothetical protein
MDTGLLYWETQRYVKAQKWASASIGAPLLVNMDGCIFLGAILLEEFS